MAPLGSAPAEEQPTLNSMWKVARCMRSHGLPNFPDPTGFPQHPERPAFNLSAVGISRNSPRIMTKVNECLYLVHGSLPPAR